MKCLGQLWCALVQHWFSRAPAEADASLGNDSLGRRGEDAAEQYLRQIGYRIAGRRVRLPAGELDLVAWDGPTLVFVEVKTRADNRHGEPEDAVDRVKQRRIARAALGYMKRRRLLGCSARFDVVSVVWPQGATQPRLELIRNAFESAEQ